MFSGSPGYVDDAVAFRFNPARGGFATDAKRFLHHDDLFSVCAVSDATGGVLEKIEYLDFGQPIIKDASGALVAPDPATGRLVPPSGNRLLFSGREWHAELAMYNYRTRWMEPSLGRFITRDTIGVWGDGANAGNALSYAGNASVSLADAFGQMPDDNFNGPEDWWAPAIPPQFNPSADPVTPGPIYFHDGFHPDAERRLREAAQQACNRAQCALRALDDDKIGPNQCKANRVQDRDLIRERLRQYLRHHCRGRWSNGPLKLKPDTEDPEPWVYRIRGIRWYPTRNINYPVRPDGQLRPGRDIPQDLIHEPFHYLFDTEDGTNSPFNDNEQHGLDKLIESSCNQYRRANPEYKDDTGLPPLQ